MKVSRLLMIAALTVSCDRGTVSDRADQTRKENAAPVSTSGETTAQLAAEPPQTQAPAAQPRAAKPPAPSGPVADHARATGVNPDAAVLQDFKARVDAYMKLRKSAVKDAPALKETKDPARIKAAQDGMNAEIRAARATAKHGDVFTPEIVATFRRLLYPELKGDDGHDAKAIIKDDAPTNIPFKVNAKYPDGAPVPTVPANLLVNLPTLPEPLQFRIIDKNLILLDEDADVIVDYALNVIR
jgi:hypothetical protein